MKYRMLGSTGMKVSEVSFGAWAIGANWGQTNEEESWQALVRAVENGVNFFDTADVYGDGKSERLLARLRKEVSKDLFVATKAGRKLNPHTAEAYTGANIRRFVEASLKNLQTDCLDLLQLHCPPTQVYYEPQLFEALDAMVRDGLIRHYGVSVEKVEEALKAIQFDGVQTVQIIFNLFRQRPADTFFAEANKRNVGILARVPLASGLLTGKMNRATQFEADDHRRFNRQGEAFDVGETFAGVPFDQGLQAVEALRPLVPPGVSLTRFALKWILMFDAVSCVIPGAKRPAQVDDNCGASNGAGLPENVMTEVRSIYNRYVRAAVHQRW
ncbi:MAG: aldo/keto reductase [Verrucomicrobiota bacterium]